MADDKVANPAPLGLAGFGMTTFILSAVNAGWIPRTAEPIFLTVALFYGGIAQILAGMWEFRTGNTFGATAFTSYGAFWIALASHVIFTTNKVISMGEMGGLGVAWFLLAWTIFTFYMMIASFRTNKVLQWVFIALFVTFALLTLGAFAGSSGAWLGTLGGYTGLVTALLAWYTSAAIVINGTYGREVLSLGARR